MDEQQLAAIAAEDSMPDDQLSSEARKRKEGRLRKREARAKEKQQKVAQAEAAKAKQFDNIEQYWQANRTKLDVFLLLQMEERQEYVLGLMAALEDYVKHSLEETGTTQADLDDTIQEVVSDVAVHGLGNSSVLVIDRVWTEDCAVLRSHFSKPTLDLVTYGFYTAITERAFEDFRNKFLTPRTNNPTAHGKMMICTLCKSLDTSRWVLESDKGYVCHRCIDSEQRSCATAKEALYDAQGRMKPKFWRGAKI